MAQLCWTDSAIEAFERLKAAARQAADKRAKKDRKKSSRPEGLFKQVCKTIELLRENPRHPGLQTHDYHSLEHPFKKGEKVFEAYAQNRTPGAYRVFWCYGPEKGELTIVDITAHP